MVPSWGLVVDIRIVPLKSLKVESKNVVILGFVVPASVDVEVLVNRKHGVATSWVRGVTLLVVLDLVPSVCIEVKSVKIVVSNASVASSSMAAIDINLVVVHASSSIGSWSGGTHLGSLIVRRLWLGTIGPLPLLLLSHVKPSVIEADSLSSVASKNEDPVLVRTRDS